MRQYEYSVDGGTDHDGRNVYTVLCRSWDDFDQDAGAWTRVVGWYADRSVALREAEAFQENADEARDALRRENEAAGFTTHAPRGRGVGRMENTPGPWIAEEQFNPKESGYRTTGRVFAHALHVASIHTAGSVRESDANARLISLCPELSDFARECARADSDCGEALRARARIIVAAMDRGQKDDHE